ATDEGHTCLPREQLIERARELLDVEVGPVENAINLLALAGEVIVEDDYVYLTGLYKSERGAASKIHELFAAPITLPSIDIDKALVWVQQKTDVEHAAAQRNAIKTAITSKRAVSTGGPGVGTTTTGNNTVNIRQAMNSRVVL